MTQPKQETREFTEEEAARLVEFVEILIEMDLEEKKRQKRLVEEPKGFFMPSEGRDCSLCKRYLSNEDGWYDKWGFKCRNCQDAINKRIIPGSLCRDHDNKKHIIDTELSRKTGIHTQTIRKLIRQGKIIARQIPNGPYVIMRENNPALADITSSQQAKN